VDDGKLLRALLSLASTRLQHVNFSILDSKAQLGFQLNHSRRRIAYNTNAMMLRGLVVWCYRDPIASSNPLRKPIRLVQWSGEVSRLPSNAPFFNDRGGPD
jgi:hypothetical protein